MSKSVVKKCICLLATCVALLLFMVVCRLIPSFSRFWMNAFILPVSRSLHRLSGRLPYPLLEWGMIILAGLFLSTAFVALLRALRSLRLAPIFRLLWHWMWGILIIGGAYALLWYPAYWVEPAEAMPSVSTEALSWLCESLIDDLNASDLRFSSPDEITLQASAIAGMPNAVIKSARYPEWMKALEIAGLYAPWTGEAIIDPSAPPASIPFTAVHELMHLQGIGDEGKANIAAWELCLSNGGEFAVSAKHWALKYAMTALKDADEQAWIQANRQMKDALKRTFYTMSGDVSASDNRLLDVLGLAQAANSYAALVQYLAN